MRFHPACEVFPVLEGKLFEELAADIKEKGLVHPIITLEGAILDGRNRFRACQEAGVEPRFQPYEGQLSPEAFVFSANIARRHLSVAEKALAAAKLFPVKGSIMGGGLTRAKAAELAGVPEYALSLGRTILAADHTPLEQAVRAGEVALETAALIVRDDALRTDMMAGKTTPKDAAAVVNKRAASQKRERVIAKAAGFPPAKKGVAPNLTAKRLRDLDKAKPVDNKASAQALKLNAKRTSDELARFRKNGYLDSGYLLTAKGRELAFGKEEEEAAKPDSREAQIEGLRDAVFKETGKSITRDAARFRLEDASSKTRAICEKYGLGEPIKSERALQVELQKRSAAALPVIKPDADKLAELQAFCGLLWAEVLPELGKLENAKAMKEVLCSLLQRFNPDKFQALKAKHGEGKMKFPARYVSSEELELRLRPILKDWEAQGNAHLATVVISASKKAAVKLYQYLEGWTAETSHGEKAHVQTEKHSDPSADAGTLNGVCGPSGFANGAGVQH